MLVITPIARLAFAIILSPFHGTLEGENHCQPGGKLKSGPRVMGTHGRSALGYMFLGSVAEKVT